MLGIVDTAKYFPINLVVQSGTEHHLIQPPPFKETTLRLHSSPLGVPDNVAGQAVSFHYHSLFTMVSGVWIYEASHLEESLEKIPGTINVIYFIFLPQKEKI